MATRAARYAQSFFGDEGNGLIGLPGASILIREAGTVVAAPLWADRTKTTTLVNPLPTGVPYGTPGLDIDGNAVFFADPGDSIDGSTVYEAMVTVGNTTVGPIPIGTIPPDMADVQGPIAPGTYVQPAAVNAVLAATGTYMPSAIERVRCAPGGIDVKVFAKDPTVANRIWGWQMTAPFDLGILPYDGSTFTAKAARPGVLEIQTLIFGTAYLWCLTGGALPAKSGQIWRSPLPAADGTGIVWTKVFDLDTFVAQGGTGDNSGVRNSCMAVSEPTVFLLEYSAAAITGGPSLYVSSNSGTSFDKAVTFGASKHGHAIKIIDGKPWATLGDRSAAYADIGLWTGTNTNGAGAWNRRSLIALGDGGNSHVGINFMPITIDGHTGIVLEKDTASREGPLYFPVATAGASQFALRPLFDVPPPYNGTQFGMIVTDDTLYWLQSSEGGALGSLDSLWCSKSPYTRGNLLESFAPNTIGSVGDSVDAGDWFYMGFYRITKTEWSLVA